MGSSTGKQAIRFLNAECGFRVTTLKNTSFGYRETHLYQERARTTIALLENRERYLLRQNRKVPEGLRNTLAKTKDYLSIVNTGLILAAKDQE